MGVFIATIIILALIFYALKDLLMDKDFAAWTNIALTALILFTVILSIYMLLDKPNKNVDMQESPARQEENAQKQGEKAEVDETMLNMAITYVLFEDEVNKQYPQDTQKSAQLAADYIMSEYKFNQAEFDTFIRYANENDLFNKARQIIAEHEEAEAADNSAEPTTNYLIDKTNTPASANAAAQK
ncbi:MAG: hypothetical protein LBM71_01790 [Elusimicrobiota bacterium]|jgi:hypothetical protein|nr:hypothetical protein [Elusimicrobiota bacterium]